MDSMAVVSKHSDTCKVTSANIVRNILDFKKGCLMLPSTVFGLQNGRHLVHVDNPIVLVTKTCYKSSQL